VEIHARPKREEIAATIIITNLLRIAR